MSYGYMISKHVPCSQNKPDVTAEDIEAALLAATQAMAMENEDGETWHDARDKPWPDLQWEEVLLSERKYVVPKSQLTKLITQQRCERCGEQTDHESVRSKEVSAAIRFDWKCLVSVILYLLK